MEFTGRIIQVLPMREGASAKGPWRAASYVIEETGTQYPQKMVFEVFGGDRIEQFNIKAGDELTVQFDITAREYNGKWFNSIRAWKAERVQNGMSTAPQPEQSAISAPPASDAPAAGGEPNEDLPF